MKLNIVDTSIVLAHAGVSHQLVIASPVTVHLFHEGTQVSDLTSKVRNIDDVKNHVREIERNLNKKVYVNFHGRKLVLDKHGKDFDDASTEILDSRDR